MTMNGLTQTWEFRNEQKNKQSHMITKESWNITNKGAKIKQLEKRKIIESVDSGLVPLKKTLFLSNHRKVKM